MGLGTDIAACVVVTICLSAVFGGLCFLARVDGFSGSGSRDVGFERTGSYRLR